MIRRFLGAFLGLFLATAAQAQIANTLPFQLQNNTTADATQVMADFQQIVNNVNANAAKNGSNSDITALTALSTPITPVQGGSSVYTAGASTGTANAQVVAVPTPSGFTLVSGKRLVFIAGATNTAATTLNIASTGALNIYKLGPAGPTALTGGEIIATSIVEVVYDGTQYQLVTNNLSLLGPLTTLASATTTDLGTISSHNISVSGTTTITAFGSTASTLYPIYYLKFTGAVLLTYNATSLILPSAANITTAANDTAQALYLGSGNWQVISYQRASGQPIIAAGTPLCGAIGFTLTNNAGTPNSSIDIAADQAVMLTTGGVSISATVISATVNTTVTGANGLDTGSKANSTWYNFYLVNNGTTTAGLASLSATAPTMPSGYTYLCRLGAMRTDGSGNFYRTLQHGDYTTYQIATSSNTTVPPTIASGLAGTYSTTSPTLAAATVRGAGTNPVPPTATQLMLSVNNHWKSVAGTSAIVAPSTAWGGTNNGPEGSNGQVYPLFMDNSFNANTSVLLNLEANSIAWASDSTTVALVALGWVDKVNAH